MLASNLKLGTRNLKLIFGLFWDKWGKVGIFWG